MRPGRFTPRFRGPVSHVSGFGIRQEQDQAAFAGRAGYGVVGIYKETASGVPGTTGRSEWACSF